MMYLVNFQKLNEAEKEKRKIKTLGSLASLGIIYSPYGQKKVRDSMQKPIKRVKAVIRKNPEIQKDIFRSILRTKDEIKNKTEIDDFKLEQRLKNVFRKRGIQDPDFYEDYMGRSQKAQLNTVFKKIGILPINDPSKDLNKYFDNTSTESGLKREYLDKVNSLKNHPDIKDEKIRSKMIDSLKDRYVRKGLDLKDTAQKQSKELGYKIIKGNLIKAVTNPLALGLGLGFTINSITDVIGNKRRDKVAQKKNLKIEKSKNENLKTGVNAVLGLGLLGYGSLSGKNKLVKSFLRKNKSGKVSNVKSHLRGLKGG